MPASLPLALSRAAFFHHACRVVLMYEYWWLHCKWHHCFIPTASRSSLSISLSSLLTVSFHLSPSSTRDGAHSPPCQAHPFSLHLLHGAPRRLRPRPDKHSSRWHHEVCIWQLSDLRGSKPHRRLYGSGASFGQRCSASQLAEFRTACHAINLEFRPIDFDALSCLRA